MTTLKQCVKAWQALNTLVKTEMDYASAHGLVMLRAALPEAELRVRAALCAGVTPERHAAALEVMRACQIDVI